MEWNRRQFLIGSSLALASGALAGRLPSMAAEPAEGLRELRGSVGLFTGRGGTIGWLVRKDALVVVDSQFRESAEHCLGALRERSAREIDALVNTHHHGDHTAGNGVFRPASRLIVAQRNVPGLQEKAARERGNTAEQTYADTTFETSWKLDAGGETVTATHYGPAHTGGDCVVHFAEANVAHMGDLVFNRFHPFIDRPGGASIRGWIGVLEQVLETCDDETLYIFGHAKPGFGVTGRTADVKLQRDYLSALIELAAKEIRAGKSVEEAAEHEVLQGFDEHAAPIPRASLPANLRAAYQELNEKT